MMEEEDGEDVWGRWFSWRVGCERDMVGRVRFC